MLYYPFDDARVVEVGRQGLMGLGLMSRPSTCGCGFPLNHRLELGFPTECTASPFPVATARYPA